MTRPGVREGTNPSDVFAIPEAPAFVGRGGVKLWHAMHAFEIDARARTCADFGCSTGGFTDCFLHLGAGRVHSVDTAYGQLAWKLRNDPRVTVHERTNALHADVPPDGPAELIAIDMGWTRQRHAIPAALRWLAPGGSIVTLIKPHYELEASERDLLASGGVLEERDALRVVDRTLEEIETLGARTLAVCKSPVLGGAVGGKRKRGAKASEPAAGKGNAEWLAWVRAR